MNVSTRRQIGNVLVIIAMLFGLAQVVGMMQTPRPEWSRMSAVPMLALLIVGIVLRRGARPPA
jgi:hypothetical protein